MTEVRAWECNECGALAKADTARGWRTERRRSGDLHFYPDHAEPQRQQQTARPGQSAGSESVRLLPDSSPSGSPGDSKGGSPLVPPVDYPEVPPLPQDDRGAGDFWAEPHR
jgi:hypothetical protein